MGKKSNVTDRSKLDPGIAEEAEVIEKLKTLPKINYEAYMELFKSGQIERFIKFKHPKVIFFDEETGMFCYYNPYYRKILKCAEWKSE